MIEKIKRLKAIRVLHDKLRMWSIKKGAKKYSSWLMLINIFDLDITDQYSNLKIDTEYLKLNVRAMHALQLKLIEKALSDLLCSYHGINIMDFGDSSGTHCQYIKKMYPYYEIKTLSVNIDSRAIKRIKEKGLKAIVIEEEELWEIEYKDMVMSFQVLEHLENPIKVLQDLSTITNKLVLTVPYVKRSRIGIQNLKNTNPENTHLFELSPTDWKKLFSYSGWTVGSEEIYYQYPKGIPILSWVLKKYWQRYDFEGFYGIVLEKEK
uniref:Putative methyltransferase n=1 Tax=viral metagenome TaxID=1070528 RepID=A0A6M3XYL0_9ZZZZ